MFARKKHMSIKSCIAYLCDIKNALNHTQDKPTLFMPEEIDRGADYREFVDLFYEILNKLNLLVDDQDSILSGRRSPFKTSKKMKYSHPERMNKKKEKASSFLKEEQSSYSQCDEDSREKNQESESKSLLKRTKKAQLTTISEESDSESDESWVQREKSSSNVKKQMHHHGASSRSVLQNGRTVLLKNIKEIEENFLSIHRKIKQKYKSIRIDEIQTPRDFKKWGEAIEKNFLPLQEEVKKNDFKTNCKKNESELILLEIKKNIQQMQSQTDLVLRYNFSAKSNLLLGRYYEEVDKFSRGDKDNASAREVENEIIILSDQLLIEHIKNKLLKAYIDISGITDLHVLVKQLFAAMHKKIKQIQGYFSEASEYKKLNHQIKCLEEAIFEVASYFKDTDTTYGEFSLRNPRFFMPSAKERLQTDIDHVRGTLFSVIKVDMINHLNQAIRKIDRYLKTTNPVWYERFYLKFRNSSHPERVHARRRRAIILKQALNSDLNNIKAEKNLDNLLKRHSNISLALHQSLIEDVEIINQAYPEDFISKGNSSQKKLIIGILNDWQHTSLCGHWLESTLQVQNYFLNQEADAGDDGEDQVLELIRIQNRFQLYKLGRSALLHFEPIALFHNISEFFHMFDPVFYVEQKNSLMEIFKRLQSCVEVNHYLKMLSDIFIKISDLKLREEKNKKIAYKEKYQKTLYDLFFGIIDIAFVPKQGVALPLEYGQMKWVMYHVEQVLALNKNVHQPVVHRLRKRYRLLENSHGYRPLVEQSELKLFNLSETETPKQSNEKENESTEDNARKVKRLNIFYSKLYAKISQNLKAETIIASNRFVLRDGLFALASLPVQLGLKALPIPGFISAGVGSGVTAIDQYQQVSAACNISQVVEQGDNLKRIVSFVSKHMTFYLQHSIKEMLKPEEFAEFCYERIKNKLDDLINQNRIEDLILVLPEFNLADDWRLFRKSFCTDQDSSYKKTMKGIAEHSALIILDDRAESDSSKSDYKIHSIYYQKGLVNQHKTENKYAPAILCLSQMSPQLNKMIKEGYEEQYKMDSPSFDKGVDVAKTQQTIPSLLGSESQDHGMQITNKSVLTKFEAYTKEIFSPDDLVPLVKQMAK